jgi:hypothetical protein
MRLSLYRVMSLITGFATGLALWSGSEWATGKAEPWDTMNYYLTMLCAIGVFGGLLFSRAPISFYLAMVAGQTVGFFSLPGAPGPLLPVGLVLLVIYSLVSLLSIAAVAVVIHLLSRRARRSR